MLIRLDQSGRIGIGTEQERLGNVPIRLGQTKSQGATRMIIALDEVVTPSLAFMTQPQ